MEMEVNASVAFSEQWSLWSGALSVKPGWIHTEAPVDVTQWSEWRDWERQVGEEVECWAGPAWGPRANIRHRGINYILCSLEHTLGTAVIRRSPIRPAVS